MIIENFSLWKNRDNEEQFRDYYANELMKKSVFECVKDLSYQLYCMQICMEGLIEEIVELQTKKVVARKGTALKEPKKKAKAPSFTEGKKKSKAPIKTSKAKK